MTVKLEDVVISYTIGDFRESGFKEYFLQRIRGQYSPVEFRAVDGVSFELEKGDFLGIVGKNGAGKTTLLKSIAGIIRPNEGKVTLNGKVAALLALGVGFDPDLTVKENIFLRSALLGFSREFAYTAYEDILRFAELEEFEHRPLRQLSSGMNARLAFSVACLVNPEILILDEVLAVGDGSFREKSEAKMKEIISSGATTIFVSHSTSQMRSLCNKALWLERGKQMAFGDAGEVIGMYEEFLKGK